MTDDDPPSTNSTFRSAAHRKRALTVLALLGGGFVAVTVSLWAFAPQVFDPVWLRNRIETTDAAAPVVFVLLQTVQVVFAPIPGQVLGTVGGYLFGSVLGTVYSMLGVTIGSTIVFVASRRYGRPFVARVLTDDALTRVDAFVDAYGAPGLFVAFLLPTFPDDAICLVAGLTTIRFRTFLVLLLVGRTPTFLAAAYAGTALANGRVDRFLLVLVGLLLVSTAVYYLRSRIADRLGPVTDRGG